MPASSRGKAPNPKSRKQARFLTIKSRPGYLDLSLREHLMIKLALAIEANGWKQAEAASFLDVSQPRISDLMRCRADKFTVDTLIQWLWMLGKRVTVTIDDKPPGPGYWGPQIEGDEAIDYFTKVIALDPNNVGAYKKRAEAYRTMALEENQRLSFESGDHHPEDAVRDWKQRQRSLLEQAATDYARCVELLPDRPWPRLARVNITRLLGEVCQDPGQFDEALKQCDDVIRLWPEDDTGYSYRAMTWQRQGDKDRALQDYSKSIELSPTRQGDYWNRAMLYEELGRDDEAIADYTRVLELDPDYHWAQEKRSALLARRQPA